MRTALFLLATLLVIAGCDTSDVPADQPEPMLSNALDSALVIGAWGISRARQEERVTVMVAQAVPDLSKPAASVLEMSGPYPMTFRYVPEYSHYYEPSGVGHSFAISDNPSRGLEYGSVLSIGHTLSGDSLHIQVTIDSSIDPGPQFYYLVDAEIDGVSFSRLGIEFDSVAVPHYQYQDNTPTGPVTIHGRYEPAVRRIRAGEFLARRLFGRFLPYADSLVLEGGGQLRFVRDSGLMSQTQIGVWTIEESRLRLRIPDQALDLAFMVEETKEGLQLISVEPGSDPGDFARFSVEARFRVEPGTVEQLRTVSTLDLKR